MRLSYFQEAEEVRSDKQKRIIKSTEFIYEGILGNICLQYYF